MAQAPIHVLLVEDDDRYAEFVGAELTSCKAPVTVRRAGTLAEASRLVSGGGIDVILLDLGLPDSAGLETVERMQRASSDLPIVVLTSADDDELAIAAVQSGADDYLIKSATGGPLLCRAIRYACERAALRRTLSGSEEQLLQAQRMEAVGRLAGGVAHDFNNILSAIFGYVDLLLDQFASDDPRRADVEEIRRSAERAAGLTRQLLAFSRKQVLQPRVVNLNDVIAGLRGLLIRLMGERVEFCLDADPDLWNVRADPGQIEQVVINLCTNARDAMPDGGRLTIATRNVAVTAGHAEERPGLRPGAYVVLTVEDTGIGMPQEVLRHIFEPFFTTKEQGKGTGLGLATAYGVVKQSGGGIYADSVEGSGARLLVYLPKLRDGA
jgi:signal transduction histidine kinase